VTFLAARSLSDVADADAIIHGIPYDGAVSWRAGASEGPAAIRHASGSLETYSARIRRDLDDIALADAADLEVEGRGGEGLFDLIAERSATLARRTPLLVTLGGDHSISMGTSAGLRAVHDGLAHVVFDAHLDMRPDWEGDRWSHACGTRRMAAAGPTCVLGIRSGSRQEFADADRMLAAWSASIEPTDAVRAAIEGRPVFVSVDLDVLDPSTFPGTGNPEPGGPGYREVREAVLAVMDGQRVVGIDLVEVAPPIDRTAVSATVAAALARDLILAATG
jgi:agmatinase